MRKYAVLIACLVALQGSVRADHRPAFGSCLGDGAYQKASGRSPVELELYSHRGSSGSSWTDRDQDIDAGPDLAAQNDERRMREEMQSDSSSGAPGSYQTETRDSSGQSGSDQPAYNPDWDNPHKGGMKSQMRDRGGAEMTPGAKIASPHSSRARFGSRLGDGALSKASGRSELELQLSRDEACAEFEDLSDQHSEWVPVDRSQSLSESLSETERLSPAETPVSTETLQGLEAQGIPATAEVGTSDSFESFPETAKVSPDFANSYDTEITPDAEDFSLRDLGWSKDDYNAQGVPATSETGKASSDSSKDISTSSSAPIDATGTADISGNSSAQPASAMDRELSSRIMRDLTSESPENTSAQTFTSEGLRNVQFKSVNGMVTIQGSVRSDMEKKNLESRVKQMNGVLTVNNQLQVVPGLGPDHFDLRNDFSIPDEYPPKD